MFRVHQRITTFMIRDNDLLNISFIKKIYIMFGRDEINNLKDLLKELSIVAKFKNKIFEINKSLDKFSEKINKLE